MNQPLFHSLPTWALLALLGVAYLFMGWLDDQGTQGTPSSATDPTSAQPQPLRSAPNMHEAIRLACASHGATGYVNRYGDIQCAINGKPSFYVHVTRSQP